MRYGKSCDRYGDFIAIQLTIDDIKKLMEVGWVQGLEGNPYNLRIFVSRVS